MRFSIDLCLSSSLCAYQRCKLPSACEIVILLLRGLCYCSFILFFWAALQSCLPLGATPPYPSRTRTRTRTLT